MELLDFVILIRNTVNKVVASCTKASPDEIASTLVDIYNESFTSPEWGGNDEVDEVSCSSLCNFPFHDIDFGLEKPKLLFFGIKDMQIFWLYDTDIHSKVGVQVDLKENYMKIFECDDDIKFLGHLVSKNKVLMDPKNVQVIIDWQAPRHVKDLRSFLGLANYYRKFIAGYSKRAAALTDLLKKRHKMGVV